MPQSVTYVALGYHAGFLTLPLAFYHEQEQT